ncbi:bifunctional diaminohydroxyphosphoribosylaminopyrimidine deaminase/5-amino-6-(5-phosphoribosylamino)uracil reductase RibD [Algivirga pacifica]|uniref:Riboflavin biosynthesis protein RibD n=1 Tax=Algivirga pacifica TaxID=1162670 RepID=A0ABP9DKZ2_9BACT
MSNKELYMARALELARLGRGKVSPNPMVGCVIVYQNKIIGEGYHQVYGGPHAEVNAVNSVEDKTLLKKAEMYVTLEPCSHHGKTPPCADLIVKHQLKKVYVCNLDPNPLVAGRGIDRLKENGIEVETGLLQEEGEAVNARFFTFMREKRPYVIMKWAQTKDGFIARKNYDSKWISNPLSRKQVHKWRSEEDGILVGTNTAHYDNPRLDVRDWTGSSPIRIVLDRNLRLAPKELALFDQSIQTICYNFKKSVEEGKVTYVKIPSENWLQEVLRDLYERKIQSIIVEGGAVVLNTFIAEELWDEMRIFRGDQHFGSGIPAPIFKGGYLVDERTVGNDKRLIYKRQNL